MLRWERGNFKALVNGFNHWAGIASSHCDVTTGGGGVFLTRRRETFERDLLVSFLNLKPHALVVPRCGGSPVFELFFLGWDS